MLKTRRVKCLSIRQHFANACIYGLKWCENRSNWNFRYTGTIYIHSGTTDDGPLQQYGLPEPRNAPVYFGALIGKVYLHSVQHFDDMQDFLNSAYETGFENKLRAGVPGVRKDMTDNQFIESIKFCGGPDCLIMVDRKPLSRPHYMPGKLGIFEADIPVELTV